MYRVQIESRKEYNDSKSYSIQKNELNKIIDNESTRLANAIKRKRKKK